MREEERSDRGGESPKKKGKVEMGAYNDPNSTTRAVGLVWGRGGNSKGHGRIYPSSSSPPSSSSSPSPPFSIQGRGGVASGLSLTLTLTLVCRFYPNSVPSRPETKSPFTPAILLTFASKAVSFISLLSVLLSRLWRADDLRSSIAPPR